MSYNGGTFNNLLTTTFFFSKKETRANLSNDKIIILSVTKRKICKEIGPII